MAIGHDTAAIKVAWETADQGSKLYEGDAFLAMREMPADSVDCIWTDPLISCLTMESLAWQARWSA